MLASLAKFIATAGYVGFVPVAPGTFGSMVGLAIYAGLRFVHSVTLETVVIALVLGIGVWSADRIERLLGKDPRQVVIDEVLGMLVTLAFIDVSITGALVGFFIFRLLDVIKPYPAGRLEHLHGGPGIMLDDAMAGVYSNLALRALIFAFPGLLS